LDIHQRDLSLLLALDVLLEEESVSAAATRLGLSQPAMSSQLRRLRNLFQDPLLTPSGRRLVATTRALEIKDSLKEHLNGLDLLVRENRGFDPATSGNTFRIIATDYAHAVLAPIFGKWIAAQAPNARLAFLPFSPPDVWPSLTEDRADLALVTSMSLPEAKTLPGLEEGFCVILRKGHPLGAGPMSLEAFCSAEHVLASPEGGGFVGAADKILAERGYQRRVALSAPSFLLAPAIVARTDYICLLPRRLAVLYEHMVDSIELPFETPVFRMDLFWHPRRQHDPAHIWFRQEVKKLIEAV